MSMYRLVCKCVVLTGAVCVLSGAGCPANPDDVLPVPDPIPGPPGEQGPPGTDAAVTAGTGVLVTDGVVSLDTDFTDGLYWKLGGNAGTVAGADVIGTTDNQALELHVNGERVLRLEPTTDSPNIIGGHELNTVDAGVVGATIAGGGTPDDGGGAAAPNTVSADYGAIGGGIRNRASGIQSTIASGGFNTTSGAQSAVGGGVANQASSTNATIAGGALNQATEFNATVGGGQLNKASAAFAAVLGGQQNVASGEHSAVGGGQSNSATADHATVGGGSVNTASGVESTVSGGRQNAASELRSTIGGGFDNTASGDYATVCGGLSNTASFVGAAIGGGVRNTASLGGATVAGGNDNAASGTGSTVGGGAFNTSSGTTSTVAGGFDNAASSLRSTVGGGQGNSATNDHATVAGGENNAAGSINSFIGGGEDNSTAGNWAFVGAGRGNQSNGSRSAILGGENNRITGGFGAILGGRECEVLAEAGFALGRQVKIANVHPGAILFADNTQEDFNSTAFDEFAVRAGGGVRMVTAVDNDGTPTAGVRLAGGGSAWLTISDRNAKENFKKVDSREILERLVAIPVETWNYKTQDASIRHMGPMAQDFSAAFGLGPDEKRISTIDADGVALAAIQGLHAIVKERNAEIAALTARLERIEAMLDGRANLASEGGRPLPQAAIAVARAHDCNDNGVPLLHRQGGGPVNGDLGQRASLTQEAIRVEYDHRPGIVVCLAGIE